MGKLSHWLKEEIIKVLPAVIFFLFAFNIIHFSDTLILRAEDVKYTGYIGATLGAILAGKTILIAESFPFINAFPNRPLIYNIVWKFFIFGICAILVQLLDFYIKQLYHHHSFSIANQHITELLTISLFWGVQIWVLFLFFIFVFQSELIHAIGGRKVFDLLFK